ncbi:MAG: zinc ribbon domain-containing protein [Gemmatimonadales bacterium]
MTDLERLVARLIEVLRNRDASSLHRPLTVADLRATVLPYRLHRSAIGLSSAEDYDLLVLRLMAEEDGWVRTFPPEAAAKARTEVASSNPDLELVEALGDATVQIGAATVARFDEAPAESPRASSWAPPPPIAAAEAALVPEVPAVPDVAAPPATAAFPVVAPSPVDAPPPPPPPPAVEIPMFESVVVESAAPSSEPETPTCKACHQALPTHRPVGFCPFCGRQVGVLRCARCSEEIEPGWRHCINCGLAAGSGPGPAVP